MSAQMRASPRSKAKALLAPYALVGGREYTMRTEFQTAIAQLIHEKGLPQEKVMEAVANALLAAYRKGVGGGENIRIEVERSGDVHVWATKRVVAQAHDTAQEISLADAQQIDPHAALGQS